MLRHLSFNRNSWPEGRFLRMSHISAVMKKYPLTSFFVLAYAFSWWPWILYALGKFDTPIASFGPFVAAMVVLAVTQRKAGVMGLLRRMGRWRVGVGWYAVALGLPALLTLSATALNVVMGAEAPTSTELKGWTGLFATFALVLLVPGVGGAWEEPGWRGYAVPRLQSRRSALSASLILGALIAGWHLPLMVAGQVHYSDIVLIFAAVIVVNWLFNNARGSVLIVMVLHAANNTISGSFFSPMFSGADSVRQSWLLALVWWVMAILVIAFSGPTHLSRKHSRQIDETYGPAAERPAKVEPVLGEQQERREVQARNRKE